MLEGAALPALAAFILSRFMGTAGVWLYFAAGEALTLLGLALFIRRRTGRLPWQDGACLLLKESFGVPAEDLMEADIHSMSEVTAAAQAAEAFCRRHGQSEKIGNHIALCIEEMAGNVIQHGFAPGGKNHLSIRVLHAGEGTLWTDLKGAALTLPASGTANKK